MSIIRPLVICALLAPAARGQVDPPERTGPRGQGELEKALFRARDLNCANNLNQLWKFQNLYRIQFGGPAKLMPAETGPAFWLKLEQTKPQLLDESCLDMLVCPFSGEKPRPHFTTYWGPAVDVAKAADNDPVGCCEPGHHPDGSINVLRKSGDVEGTRPGEALYEEALRKTAGDPVRVIARNERFAALGLKAIAAAEADFRANDRDGNGGNDFWVGDVSGLYRFTRGGQALRLIDRTVAEADAAPLRTGELGPAPAEKPRPRHGYLFVSLPAYESGSDLLKYHKGDHRNPGAFGFAAIPADYGKSGKNTLITSEGNRIFWKDTEGKAPDRFPENLARDGWQPLP